MKKQKILHIGSATVFLPPFIRLLSKEFSSYDHEYYLTSSISNNDLPSDKTVILIDGNGTARKCINYFKMLLRMATSDKIILHGLFNPIVVLILFFMPWVLKKTYWVIWGSDLYTYTRSKNNIKRRFYEIFRRPVIKNIAYLVTYVKGDYDLACKWYKARGTYLECLMYSSNVFKDYEIKEKASLGTTIILVGNSADPENQHLEVFERLKQFPGDIKIYAPLAYGDQKYAQKIINEGEKNFGDSFIPMTEMLSYDKYIEFLSGVDIAIFNHKQQQAMGNTITLLGLGKKVYIQRNLTHSTFLENLGIKMFELSSFNLSLLGSIEKEKNEAIVKQYFSNKNYHQQLRNLFK